MPPAAPQTVLVTGASSGIGRATARLFGERGARKVVGTLDRPRRLVQSGFANPVVIAGFRLLPAVYDALVGPLLRTFALGREQVPPTEGNVFTSRPEGNAER